MYALVRGESLSWKCPENVLDMSGQGLCPHSCVAVPYCKGMVRIYVL